MSSTRQIRAKKQATGSNQQRPFFAAMLMVALMLPAAIAAGPTAVNLGTAGNFAVLAGSLISNIPPSVIGCDIGLSPAAGSNITGIGLTEVAGTIYAVDATGPASSVSAAAMLTIAKNDLTTAYNDAANRTPVPAGAFLNPGSGNLGGMTLVPGLYKFTSGALVTGGNLTLTGSATDVWIFQIGTDLTVGSGIQVILDGGAQAANIFWQVGSSATIGTGSAFKGTIMADQSISLNTGATLDGRALARIAAVTLASNTINCVSDSSTIGSDTVRPTVSYTVPANSAMCVAINSKVVVAAFSEMMDSSTFTSETFNVKFGTTPVLGTVSYTGTSATFTPATGNLPPNTTFIATITSGAKDLAGNAMAENYVWSFATCETPDTTRPIVTTTNAGQCVAINSKIATVFSEAMNPQTITSSTYFVQNGATLIPGTVIASGSNAIFTPDSFFAPLTHFTVTLKSGGPATGVHDMVCNTLYSDYVWNFTTCDDPDTMSPTVTYIGIDTITAGTPFALNKRTALLTGTPTAKTIISFAFSKKMDPLTITTGTVALRQGTAPISGTVFAIDTIAYFTSAGSLEPEMAYTVTISTGVRDLAGNALAGDFVWNFSTAVTVEKDKTGASSQSETFQLSQNNPNPFNPSTKIQYSLGKAAQVSLKVYNSFGHEVATLVNGRQEAGSHSVSFITQKGTLSLSSGVYFYRLKAGSFVSMKKLILMK